MTDSPDLHARYYRAFTLDESEDDAAGAFTARYGAPPEHIVESHGLLYVGPIPQKENPCLDTTKPSAHPPSPQG